MEQYLMFFLIVLVLVLGFLLLKPRVPTKPKPRNLTYEGILHIGIFEGKTNYNLEILVPLEDIETMDSIRLKIDRRL